MKCITESAQEKGFESANNTYKKYSVPPHQLENIEVDIPVHTKTIASKVFSISDELTKASMNDRSCISNLSSTYDLLNMSKNEKKIALETRLYKLLDYQK